MARNPTINASRFTEFARWDVADREAGLGYCSVFERKVGEMNDQGGRIGPDSEGME